MRWRRFFFFSIYKLLYDGLKDKDIYNDINNNHYQNMYMTGKGISRRRERRIRNINLGLSQHLFPFLTLALRKPFPPPGPSKIAKSSSMALETKNQSHISDLNLLLLITTPGTSHSSTPYLSQMLLTRGRHFPITSIGDKDWIPLCMGISFLQVISHS